MNEKNKKFDDTEIEEHKSLISISDMDIDEIIASNKFSFAQQDFKCFVGYKDNKETRLLW